MNRIVLRGLMAGGFRRNVFSMVGEFLLLAVSFGLRPPFPDRVERLPAPEVPLKPTYTNRRNSSAAGPASPASFLAAVEHFFQPLVEFVEVIRDPNLAFEVAAL